LKTHLIINGNVGRSRTEHSATKGARGAGGAEVLKVLEVLSAGGAEDDYESRYEEAHAMLIRGRYGTTPI
jgi:hypothetical protein